MLCRNLCLALLATLSSTTADRSQELARHDAVFTRFCDHGLVAENTCVCKGGSATAAIGDVVVGRVVETVLGRGQRWKVDINSQQDGHLLLSAITLPGSAMQRKLHEDKADLEMRSIFADR